MAQQRVRLGLPPAECLVHLRRVRASAERQHGAAEAAAHLLNLCLRGVWVFIDVEGVVVDLGGT